MNGAIWPAAARAFRHAALPLAWYYAVTLALPIANGAAQAVADFAEHALAVLVVPPVLIVLVCAAREIARLVFARPAGFGSLEDRDRCCAAAASGRNLSWFGEDPSKGRP